MENGIWRKNEISVSANGIYIIMSISFFLAPKTHQIKRYGRPWEIQDETYTCGPVAVINALHYFGRYVGTATR